MRRVDPQINDQRLGEPLDREFRGRIGGMRDAWPDRGPKPLMLLVLTMLLSAAFCSIGRNARVQL
jgi:hypothetical protein